MQTRSILVIEDDQDILMLIVFHLRKAGYTTMECKTGTSALPMIRQHRPALIVLDRMLPGITGERIVASLRKEADIANTPVLMLTALGSESDEITGLEAGADDYMAKPFSPKLLVARVKTLLRRPVGQVANQQKNTPDIIEFKHVILDKSTHILHLPKRLQIQLTGKESLLMELLLLSRSQLATRPNILQHVYGHEPPSSRALDVLIVGLRKKLSEAKIAIQSLRGVGYQLQVLDCEDEI